MDDSGWPDTKKMADGGHRWMKVFAAGGEGGRNQRATLVVNRPWKCFVCG
jgi:hypothetical protein